jgi:hypothetical protein
VVDTALLDDVILDMWWKAYFIICGFIDNWELEYIPIVDCRFQSLHNVGRFDLYKHFDFFVTLWVDMSTIASDMVSSIGNIADLLFIFLLKYFRFLHSTQIIKSYKSLWFPPLLKVIKTKSI